MNPLFFITSTLTGGCLIGLMILVLHKRQQKAKVRWVRAVLEEVSQSSLAPRRRRSAGNTAQKLMHWVTQRLGVFQDAQMLARFERAGITRQSSMDTYAAARLLGPLAGVFIASFSPWQRPVCMLILASISYLLPDIALVRMTAMRKEKLRLAVPDAIDLLVICVNAGLGIDQAMMRVAVELGKAHPALQGEFLRVNGEQRAGQQRLDAWKSMAQRSQLIELDGFVNMLAQTERFGTPIARALADFSDEIRQKRRQRAEELAAKTTIKILFPLVLCIFPSIFIVLLGPPGISISHGLLQGLQ